MCIVFVTSCFNFAFSLSSDSTLSILASFPCSILVDFLNPRAVLDSYKVM